MMSTSQNSDESTDSLSRIACIGLVTIGLAALVATIVNRRLARESNLSQLNERAVALIGQFGRTARLVDISEAVTTLKRAIELTAEGYTHLPVMLNNLGSALKDRFEHTGELSDIVDAISALEKAVRLTPDGSEMLPVRLTHLATSLQCRFTRTADFGDIEKANALLQRAVHDIPDGDPHLASRLSTLGVSFVHLFGYTGELDHIAEAVSTLQRAVRLASGNHAELSALRNNLGMAFSARFERTGELRDIAEAISEQQRAVEAAPEHHPNLPIWLTNAGGSYLLRFVRTADLSDISEAISVLEQAVEMTPAGHTDLPTRLSTLSASYQSRYRLTKNPSDIETAILKGRRAVVLTPEQHALLPTHLNALGHSLLVQFQQTRDLSEIDEAISVLQRAAELTPERHASQYLRLNNLGLAFFSRYEQSGAHSDIDAAILAQERAIREAPKCHADLPIQLSNLGRFRYSRSCLLGSSEDLDGSIASYKTAATSRLGSPQIKLAAAKNWAYLSKQHHPQSTDTLDAFEAAICLLTSIAGLEQTVQRRYSQLKDVSGLVSEAAATACALGRSDKALEWLEQGRCLVWTQLNNLRTPIEDLRAHDEKLAQRVVEVSRQIESAGTFERRADVMMSLSEKITTETQARMHLNLVKEWEELLQTVRHIPRLEKFLQPIQFSALLDHLPDRGPIVVINVGTHRSDAIALLGGLNAAVHIVLPSFSLEKVKQHRSNMDTHLREKGLRMRPKPTPYRPKRGPGVDPMGKILRDLWVNLVKPIIDCLGISKMDRPQGSPLLRIWWCPTGDLSFLPIHAAGIYSGSDPDSILNYAVSSYTPNVSAIASRVGNCRPVDEKVAGLFLTDQPEGLLSSPISGTTDEVLSIYTKATVNGVRVMKEGGSAITVDDFLQRLEQYSCVHLACHATQHEEPLHSKFYFHSGTLDLATIMGRNLKNADLAFLSACQTSSGDYSLSDEAAHLAAGMLAAGYRRVVASMWSIGDQSAYKVANDFYEYLWKDNADGNRRRFDGSLSAHALHHAIEQLRKDKGDSDASLLAWVPFVHFGY